MKYTVAIILVFSVLLFGGLLAFETFAGNRDLIDTTFRYDYAIISLGNGDSFEGKVSKWRDYENSDQIQVTIDGSTFLVHSSNITLIAE